MKTIGKHHQAKPMMGLGNMNLAKGVLIVVTGNVVDALGNFGV